MTTRALMLALLITSAACKPHLSSKVEDREHIACVSNEVEERDCTKYKVLSYDATWRNEFGNAGEFVLERNNVTIRAFCSSPHCDAFINSVGKEVEAGSGISGMIIRYEPLCSNRAFVQNAIDDQHRRTGKVPTEADICWQSLIVENIQAK